MKDNNINVYKHKQGPTADQRVERTEDGKIVRQSIRVPVPPGMVNFDYQGQRYIILDLAMYGIGIEVQSPDIFQVGDVLQQTKIVFPDTLFSVDVAVIHNTVHDLGSFICGLQIVQTHDSGYIAWMSRVIEEIKNRS